MRKGLCNRHANPKLYNRSVQGFLVEGVEKINNMDWSKILPPPQGMGKINYLTAVTQVDDKLVEILDVEKILDEISPVLTDVNDDIVHEVQDQIRLCRLGRRAKRVYGGGT